MYVFSALNKCIYFILSNITVIFYSDNITKLSLKPSFLSAIYVSMFTNTVSYAHRYHTRVPNNAQDNNP